MNLVELLRGRAAAEPGRRTYTFLAGPRAEPEPVSEPVSEPSLTLAELDLRARAIAAHLQSRGLAGERVLLLYPPSLEVLPAFFGCLYAGVTAVPLPAPASGRDRRALTRLAAVYRDAAPAAVMTTAALSPALRELAPPAMRLPDVASDAVPDGLAGEWREPEIPRDGLAYLQYTSGSTSDPRGVRVSHANVLANSELLRRGFRFTPDSTAVWWTPYFHDDGLLLGLIQPLYTGYRTFLMPPAAVVQRPDLWLRTLSERGATHGGGPNFIYALCVRKVSPEQRAGLDLSRWRVAYNAAEPIRTETLEGFASAFGPSGFRFSSFLPAYGLAEATLVVTALDAGDPEPVVRAFDRAALEAHRATEVRDGGAPAQRLAGSGRPILDARVVIVDPETAVPCPPERIGEVWIAGASVAQGYWGLAEATERTFGARLADGEGPFLRTGDLGFLFDGELFVTGRLKDLIIVHGRNVAPQDLELAAEGSHPAVRPGCGAAFAVQHGGEERVAIVQEIQTEPPPDLEEIARAIRQAVTLEHEVQVWSVVLVRPGTLPKTSSGKIQRGACRAALLEGRLEAVGSWTLGLSPAPPAAGSGERADALIQWLRGYAGTRINSRLMDERRSIPPYVVLDFGNRGLLGLQAAESLGGAGLDTRGALRVLEQLGAIDLTLASLVIGHNSLGLRPVQRFAPPAVREELLPRLASGRELAAFALTEPGAGSNPRAIEATAVPDGAGGWRLYGTKIWSGSSSWAGVIHVFARLVEDGRPAGITGFLVRQGAPGLRLGPEALTMGLRGMVQSAVHLDGVPAGPADLLGAPGAGLEVARDAMEFTRLCLGAAATGAMKRCAQWMLRYASGRTIATGRLLDHPVTLARLSGLTAATGALEAFVAVLAERFDTGEPVPPEATAACKIAAGELLWEAADGLMQLLGGRGYMESNPAAQLLRDARVIRIYEGPTETLAAYLGSSVLDGSPDLERFLAGLGAAEVWDRLRQASARVLARLSASGSPLPDRSAALVWARALVGEMAAAGLLWAASLRAAGLAGLGGGASRAATWARLRFEESVARGLAGPPAEAVLLGAGEAAGLVDGFAGSIGEVEPDPVEEEREMDPLLRRERPAAAAPLAPAPPRGQTFHRPVSGGGREIRAWLVRWLVREIGLAESAVDTAAPLVTQGLDSMTGLRLAREVEDWLGRPVDPTLVWDSPSIDAIAAALAGPPPAAPAVPEAGEQDLERLLAEIEGLGEEEARKALREGLRR